MEHEWTESESRFGTKIYKKVSGIIQLKLTPDPNPRTKEKYHGEILILGCVVQTGTYYGVLESIQKQIHEHANKVLEIACNDMSKGSK